MTLASLVAVWAFFVVGSLRNAASSLSTIDLPTVQVVAPANEIAVPAGASNVGELRDDTEDTDPTSPIEPVESLAPSPALADIASIPILGGASTLSVQQRCSLLRTWGYYVRESQNPDAYNRLSDEELERLAESEDDGFAQYLLATRIKNRYWDEYFSAAPLVLDEQLEKMKENYIYAVRSHSVDAARWLMVYEYRLGNKVEAAAWKRIRDDMVERSRGLVGVDLMRYFSFTEQEEAEGRARSLEIISEFDLTPGLSPPEECG